jgi:TrmH family RNA methyltransferase
MNAIISSRQNPLCQLARSLRQSKFRRKHRQFLIEGENSVKSALSARWELTAILCVPEKIKELQQLIVTHGYDSVILHAVEEDVLQSVCETQTAPKVAAIGALKSTFNEERWQRAKVLLVLDGVADPGNLGTLLRAADASGVDGILLTGDCADPFSPKVVRSSAGSLFHCPPRMIDTKVLLAKAREYRFSLIAANAHGGDNCFDFEWPEKYFLILGNEKHGISSELLAACTHHITIPIKGRAESLNVAMAGTVLLFQHSKNSIIEKKFS